MAEKDANRALALLGEGKVVMIGEFRGGKAERIDYTDRKSGKRTHFNRIAHAFEVGAQAEQVRVTERMDDEADTSKYQVPFKKGDRMLIVVESIDIDKGNRTVAASEILAL
jgi:hypothetical protein